MLDDLIYVVSIKNKRSSKLNKIQKETGVKIFTYKDERINSTYSPSITGHIMKKFMKEYPDYSKIFFYLDPDVLFRKKPEYNNSIIKSNVWFLSDTKSYIDKEYIESKGKELLILMCEIVGISPEIIKKHNKNAGGAQYIMKNATSEFWGKVEKDSENLYDLMYKTKDKFNPEHPIQAWTAEMWAVLWNAWYFNNKTIIIKELDFSWATDKINKYENSNIFHNAGVINEKHLFNKGLYSNKHPFNDDFSYVTNKHCSFKYVEEILETKKNYKELIKKL